MGKPNMAMLGMAVMGSNLAQNFAEKGCDIAMFNRTDAKTLAAYEAISDEVEYKKRLHPVTGEIDKLVELVGARGIYFVMVKAGEATQAMIDLLRPRLGEGAVIVDCANSYWKDTNKRSEFFEGRGIHFFGVGVSGGEEGARYGPSIMMGGTSKRIYEQRLKGALEEVAAKAADGKPCVAYLGDKGAGHFVKMVHNGIEYGDMELIAEAYDLMREVGISTGEIGDVFAKWNKGVLKSYLIEITAKVLGQKDPSWEGQLVDYILGRARMKGTGTWTIMSSLEGEVEPIPTIYAAVEARAISAKKDERVMMSEELPLPRREFKGDKKQLISDLGQALYVAKISSYAQGIALMQKSELNLDIGEIARIWRAGCIIRAEFLGEITEAYRENPELPNLMLAPTFKEAVQRGMESLEKICSIATEVRVPAMAFDASRNYVLQCVSKSLPANLIQAQRDYFGAHTYERIDQLRGKSFHLDWLGDKEEREV